MENESDPDLNHFKQACAPPSRFDLKRIINEEPAPVRRSCSIAKQVHRKARKNDTNHLRGYPFAWLAMQHAQAAPNVAN